MTDNVSAEQLRLFIERIERLEEEKRGISEDVKDVYSEAKSTGFDTKTMREIVKLRRMDKNARDEAEALLDTYKAALGLDGLGGAVRQFERATEGVAVSMSIGDGPLVAINENAREDEDYHAAVALVCANNKASTSWLQRQLRLGYNSAARLIERMEKEGIVSAPNHVGRREVLS